MFKRGHHSLSRSSSGKSHADDAHPQQQQQQQLSVDQLLRKKSLSPLEVAAVRENLLKQKLDERTARLQQAFQRPLVDDTTMSVGHGILARGDVEGCEKLLVHGGYEGCYEGEYLYVGPGARFSGTAVVVTAQVEGALEGELHAHRLLQIASSGSVQGLVRFGQLQQQQGAALRGDVAQLQTDADDDDDAAATAVIGM